MKRTIPLLVLCLIGYATFGNIVFQGNTYTSYSGNSPSDPGTLKFNYDSYSGPGGYETFLRVDNYWYRITTGIGISNSANQYVLARTVDPFCSDSPPASAHWYIYPSNPSYSGVLWQNYPSNSPPSANLSYTLSTYSLSGQVGSITYSTSLVAPDYIDLPNRPSSILTGVSPSTGRIYYNQCEQSVDLGNGSAWKTLWPNTKNYFLQKNQAFEFGNSQTQVVADLGVGAYGTGSSNIMQLNLIADNKKALVLGRDFDNYSSDLNFSGSVGSSTNIQFADYTLTDSDHLVVLHGSSPASTFTLPSSVFPTTVRGRQYIIINTSASNLTISPSVVGLPSSILAPNSSAMLINMGNWYKVN